jgi:DNA polymerase-3 subunit beta
MLAVQIKNPMKFTVNKNSLEKAMSQIDTIVPGRDTQTLLSNVLLTVSSDNKLRITASDMESTVRITLAVEDANPGELIIKAKKLSDIARQINSDTVIFEAEESEEQESEDEKQFRVKLEGRGGRSARFRMTGSDRSHFPEINEISPDKLSVIPADIISDMISKTFYSISHEDNRYIYNGLCLQAQGNNFTIVGTDGRRLAAITRMMPGAIDFKNGDGDIVVHARAIRELQKIIDIESDVQVGVEQREIFFKAGNAELSSRLLEGKFPDFKKVIPATSSIHVDIDRDVLLDSIKQVMVMTEQPSFQVRLGLGNAESYLKANTPDMGEAEVELPVTIESENIEIGFNANYFLDILKAMNCSKVKLKLSDPAKPIVFEDTTDENFIALVMPMKI